MRLEEICHEVVGLVPVYSDTGEGCLVIGRAAADQNFYSFQESRQLEAVKRHLARCFALDLSAQARLLQREYHRSPPLPFYFADGRIFVPLKLRLPRVVGDTSYGYIELGIIDRVMPGENNHCRVLLTDGTSFPVYTQISTARLSVYFGIEIGRDMFVHNPYGQQREVLQALRTLTCYIGSFFL